MAPRPSPWDRVRPGSQAHRILVTIDRLSSEFERGVTIREVREEFRNDHGTEPPSSLTPTVHNMKRRGVLESVGGRPGHTLLAPAGSALRGEEREDDEMLLVLEALRRRCGALSRAVSTRDVLQEFRSLFPEHDLANENTVRKHLETLSRARNRGPEAFRDPKVVRVDGDPVSGLPAAFWAPADMVADPANLSTTPRSAADAVRRAVGWAEPELGRPVAASELRWWADSADGMWARLDGRLCRSEIGRVLADTARTDRETEGVQGRIRTVRSRYTCHGGPPVRYSVAPPDDLTTAACLVVDLTLVLRPWDEIRSMERLVDRNVRTEREIVTVVLAERFASLAEPFARTTEMGGRPHLRNCVRKANETLYFWMWTGSDGAGVWAHRLREVNALLNQMWFFSRGLADRYYPREGSPKIVGEASAVITFAQLRPLLLSAGRALGLTDERARRVLLRRARRLPVPDEAPSRDPRGWDATPLSGLDRVDALLALWEQVPVPAALTLIRAAHDLLGHVLRDPHYLRVCLRETPEADAWLRQVLVTAIGLLGEQVDPGEAVPDSRAHDDAKAWVLATVLASRGGALERIEDTAASSFRGQAARVAETAIRRLEAGHFVSVIG